MLVLESSFSSLSIRLLCFPVSVGYLVGMLFRHLERGTQVAEAVLYLRGRCLPAS